MEIKVIKNEGLFRHYEGTIFAKDIAKAVDGKLVSYQKKVRLPGFRPGKVPTKVMQQRFGKDVLGEVLQTMLSEQVQKIIEKYKFRPAISPRPNVKSFEEGKDLVFDLEVDVMPEFEVGNVSDLKVTGYQIIPEAKEVDDELSSLAKSMRKSDPVKTKRKAKNGDVAVIDFEGFIDGVAFEGGAGKDFQLELGSGQFIPGFEDKIIGEKAGESLDVNISFPENYQAQDLAGKPVVFKVTIKELRQFTEQTIDDEFAKSLGMETLDKLKEAIEARLGERYVDVGKQATKRNVLDAIYKVYDFEISPRMVQSEFDGIWHSLIESYKKGEVDADDKNKSEKELADYYKQIAHRRVQLGLVLSEIGRSHEIEVTDADLNGLMVQQAQQYNYPVQEIQKLYQKDRNALNSLQAQAFEDKVIQYIVEQAKAQSKKVSYKDVMTVLEKPLEVGRTISGDIVIKEPLPKLIEEKETPKAKPSKKIAAKKTAVKKTAVKKATTKKTAAKKTTTKKTASKKTVAKKTVANKK